jgi:uncharacterized protein YukE
MPEPLHVDPIDVHLAGNRVSVAVHTAATAFANHESELADAESGWVGASREALRELTSALSAKHAAYCAAVMELSQHMSDAAIAYTNTDTGASESVARIAEAMGM